MMTQRAGVAAPISMSCCTGASVCVSGGCNTAAGAGTGACPRIPTDAVGAGTAATTGATARTTARTTTGATARTTARTTTGATTGATARTTARTTTTSGLLRRAGCPASAAGSAAAGRLDCVSRAAMALACTEDMFAVIAPPKFVDLFGCLADRVCHAAAARSA